MRAPLPPVARALTLVLVFAGCTAARSPIDEPKAHPEAPPPAAGASAAISSADGGNAATQAQTAAANPSPAQPEDSRAAGTDRQGTPSDVPVVDEPIYFPGGRPKPRGSAVEASLDDEVVARWNHGGLGADLNSGPKGKPPHAAPRVKVDVIDVRGDASEADVQRAARLKSYWPFRICYEQGLRRTQKLHGTIKLRLTIGPSGHPSGVQQLATELSDTAVVSCVVKSAMGLGLPAPSSGAPQVTLDISLWPGDEPVSVKTALGGKNAAPAEAPAMTDALRARLPEVRACYAAGLRRHDGLWGRLALALKITSGAVGEIIEVESHFPDPDVTECVRQAFLRAAVPSADREVVVVYPLRLGRPPDARDARH